jgi:hypothetical protein
MPFPASSVVRSPKYGMNARSSPLISSGMQALVGADGLFVRNWMLPFELTVALEYGVEYTGTSKGSGTSVTQSSQ